MSHRAPRDQSGVMGTHHSTRSGAQPNPQDRIPPADPNAFQGEIQRLHYLLEMERAGRYEDHQKLGDQEAELEETKVQWKWQKALKETFFNKKKEAKKELERVEKFSDPAALKAAAIAAKVNIDVKGKKKKSLQQDYVELKVAHILSQESFTAEILAERKKSETLQEELDKVKTSYKELDSRYEAEVSLLRQEAETLKTRVEKLSEKQRLLEKMTTEKDDMIQKMSEKIDILQDREKSLEEELEQNKLSHIDLLSKYEGQVSRLERDVETYRQKVNEERDANLKTTNENRQLIEILRAEDKFSEKLSIMLTATQNTGNMLLNDLDQLQASYDELQSMYNKDIMSLSQQLEASMQKVKKQETALTDQETKQKLLHELHQRFSTILHQQVENLELQVVQQREAYLQKSEEDEALITSLRTTNAVLLNNSANEIQFLQDKERETRAELETFKVTAGKQADQTQQEIIWVEEMEGAKEELMPETPGAEKEDFQEEEQENLEVQFNLIRSPSQEVSLKEELSSETFPGCSSDLEPAEEPKIPAEEPKISAEQTKIPAEQTKIPAEQTKIPAEEPKIPAEEPKIPAEQTEIPAETILEDVDKTETLQDGKKKKSKKSVWKRIRNFLGWKKSTRRPKREESQDQA